MVMNKFKIKKLDARYNGSTWFKYLIEPGRFDPRSIYGSGINSYSQTRNEKNIVFSEIRKWCWETYGASVELGLYNDNPLANQLWSWDTEHSYLRIYLKGDKELVLFELKWL